MDGPDELAQYAAKSASDLPPDLAQFRAGQQVPPKSTAEAAAPPSFLNTLGREGRAAVQSIVGIPGAVYHSIADPETAEEKEQVHHFPLAVERLSGGRQVANAIDWYTKAAKGEIPDAYDQALAVAPEAMGTGAGNVIAAKGVDSALDTASNMTATKATAPIRTVVKAANSTLEKAPEVIGGAAGAAVGREFGHPGYGAMGGAALGRAFLPKIRIPGEHFGLPEQVSGGPASAPAYVEPQPVYPGAPLPEHPGVFPGAPLPAVPAPEQLNPALVSEARTLPGQISPEVIYPPVAAIPRRSGLALPAAPEVEPPATSAAPVEPTAAASAATSEPAAAASPARNYRLGGDREATGPGGIQNTPDVLNNGESALRQVLTGQDNEALLKIAKSRGINVSKESQLKPAAADKLLVEKIISDFSPEELDEAHGRYVENSRFRHDFGDIGPEAWKTLGLETFFPDLKIPAARMIRTRAAITNAPLANEVPATQALGEYAAAAKKNAAPRAARRAPASTVAAPSEDLMAGLKQSLDPKVIEAIRSRKPKR